MMRVSPVPVPLPMAADLYCDVSPRQKLPWIAHVRGLCVVAAATLAAGYIADHYGLPLTLSALLMGLSLNFMNADARLAPGIGYASRSLLRWGVALVGARVTFGQIVYLGPQTFIALVIIMAVTIGAAILLSRVLGLGSRFGILAGAAVGICGASAAVAVATTLGDRRISNGQLTQVLVCITAMSAAAMFLYPILVHYLHFDDKQAGFLFGAAIHDVAQALGAGYSYSRPAGEITAIVKLTRVALLAPVLAIILIFFPAQNGRAGTIMLPGFVLAFFTLVIVNSFNLIPHMVARYADYGATIFLTAGVAATGIRAPMAELTKGTSRPALVIGGATLAALLLAAGAAVTVL